MINTSRTHKAQVLSGVALVVAAFDDVLVLRRDERCNRQQIGGSLAALEHDVPDAADKRLDNVFDPVKLFLGA